MKRRDSLRNQRALKPCCSRTRAVTIICSTILFITAGRAFGEPRPCSSSPTMQSLSAAPGSTTLTGNALLGPDNIQRLLALHCFAEAEATERSALLASTSPAPIRYLLAYTLLRENRPSEALAEYTAAAQILKPKAEDLKNVANAYALLHDYPEADHWMQRSLAMNGEDADAWYGLGRLRFSEQRFAEALTSFQEALKHAPNSSKIENNIGLSLEGLNRTDEAIDAYRRAITWQQAEIPPPSSPEQPLLNLGIALLRRGLLSEAEPLLTRAATLTPDDPRIHEHLGQLFLQQNDPLSAQKEFSRAVQLDPSNAALHFLLGQSYRRSGLRAKAESEFHLSSQLNGQHSSPEVQP